jgi:glycosyltransferase involved in cell wall biosynthesis
MSKIDLSIIVPLYNEEQNVRPLYDAVIAAAEPMGLSFELLLVDDGSRDETFFRARDLALGDRRVRVIKFRRNFGQTPAMVAGIDYARGRVLVTMDGDLQNDPRDIPALLAKIDEGYDIVVGWRQRRQDKLLTRVIPSVIANKIIGWVTGVPIRDNGCSLKAYRASLVKNIPLYSEMHRFIPAMTSLAGARVAQIAVRHHARRFGASKYGLSRVYKVLFDLLAIKTVLMLASRPMHSFTHFAVGAGAVSFAFLAYDLVLLLSDADSFSTVYLILSLQFGALALFFVSLGLLAQLVYRTGSMKTAELSFLTASVEHDTAQTLRSAGQ